MKQKITFLAIVMIMAIPKTVMAYDFSAVAPSGQTLYYNYIYGMYGYATVTFPGNQWGSLQNYWDGYTKPTGNLIIPDSVTYDGITYPVHDIASGAFYGCDGLVSVSIPNTVALIGSNTFENCTGLISVTIPNSVIGFGGATFSNCINLSSINIPNTFTSIAGSSFNNCTSLTSITIPASVNSIGNYAFSGCTNLNIVYMESLTPPAISSQTFYNCNPYFLIPCGSYSAYSASSLWSNYWLYETGMNMTISMNVNDADMGIAQHGFIQCTDSTVIILATPYYGYLFDHWNNGSILNPDTLHLTGDTAVTAFFIPNRFAVTVLSNNIEMGTVSGNDTITYLDSTIIAATANYGYHFSHWNDGDTTNPRQIQVIGDTTYTAFFDFNQFNLTVGVDDASHGYCYGDGIYNYLSIRTITATATYGYHFTMWSDGDTNNPRTITLTQDTSFTALFSKNQYSLTLHSVNDAQGSVLGGGTFEYLDTTTISATAIDHYHFVQWDDGNMDNPREFVIIGDATLTAIFAIDTHTVVVTANDIARGMVEISGTEFAYGTPCTVTATPYTGYVFTGWSNGITANPYTFAVLEDMALIANFEEEGAEGIGDVSKPDNIIVHVKDYNIFIGGVNGLQVSVYSIDGRIIATKKSETEQVSIPVPSTGVYIIKIGEYITRKLVVIR